MMFLGVFGLLVFSFMALDQGENKVKNEMDITAITGLKDRKKVKYVI